VAAPVNVPFSFHVIEVVLSSGPCPRALPAFSMMTSSPRAASSTHADEERRVVGFAEAHGAVGRQRDAGRLRDDVPARVAEDEDGVFDVLVRGEIHAVAAAGVDVHRGRRLG